MYKNCEAFMRDSAILCRAVSTEALDTVFTLFLLHLIWVYTVCSGMFVQIHTVNMVWYFFNLKVLIFFFLFLQEKTNAVGTHLKLPQ